jgi:hypothetical protein
MVIFKINQNMKIEELVKKVFIAMSKPNTEIKLEEAVLEDGSKISFDKLEKGAAINRVNPDGSTSPLEDGEFIIGDTVVTVKSGMIEDVKAEPAEAEVVAPVIEKAETPKETTKEPTKEELKNLVLTEEETKLAEDAANLLLAEYPWDQCILDQKDKGASEEVAAKICGAIRRKGMGAEAEVKPEVKAETEVKKEEVKASSELDEFKKEINLKLAEMSKQVNSSGLKQIPIEIEVKKGPTTAKDKILQLIELKKSL